jgi:hypothetical protein
VLAFIDTINDERHHFREALLDNLRRKDLEKLDEARSYNRLYQESKAPSHTAKLDEIAGLVGKSSSHIENYILVHSLPPEVKAYMDPERKTQLAVTSAIDIAKGTPNQELRVSLAREAMERELGVNEVRMLISVKTGRSGYGIQGRLRKPSDDYRIYRTKLGRTRNALDDIDNLNIEALYENREDDFGDRDRDANLIKEIIGRYEALLKKVRAK